MCLPLLTAFFLAALVHLCACLAGYLRLRRITKLLLMPLLLANYLCAAPSPSWAAAGALLCCFAGDAALAVPGAEEHGADTPSPLLFAGLGAFLLGHLLYAAAFLLDAPAWPPTRFVLQGIFCAAVLFALIFRSLRPHMGAMRLPGTLYLLVLLAMACIAAVTGLGAGAPGRILGGGLFVVSDYILARSILLGEGRRTHFFVMLTYLSAQTLLIFSLV